MIAILVYVPRPLILILGVWIKSHDLLFEDIYPIWPNTINLREMSFQTDPTWSGNQLEVFVACLCKHNLAIG